MKRREFRNFFCSLFRYGGKYVVPVFKKTEEPVGYYTSMEEMLTTLDRYLSKYHKEAYNKVSILGMAKFISCVEELVVKE